MPVYTAEDPLSCVARGAGKMVENADNQMYRRIFTQTQNTRRIKRA
jgi:rod shape-determining protein MreB